MIEPLPALPLANALRHALRDPAGRVVLRVEEAAPHRRRVARALLQEGALAAGGQVLEDPAGALVLVGAEPQRAGRLRELVERLVGTAGTMMFSLERDGAALLAHAEGAAPPRPSADGPGLAGLETCLATLPLDSVLARRIGRRTGEARPAFLRLAPDRAALASVLGPLGADPDLIDHAAARIARRLLAALADPALIRGLLGPHRPQRLHLSLPDSAADRSATAAPLVATLPVAAIAEPGFSTRADALAAAGIGLELDGLDTALPLLDPALLPSAALLRLARDPGPALARLDPARLVLAEQAAVLAAGLPGALVESPA